MMKLSLQPVVAFLVAFLVATHASLPPDPYWKSKLPTTPIPKSITDLLHPSGKLLGGGGTIIHCGNKRRPADPSYDYCYNLNLTSELHDNKPNTAVFFLEKDLKAGHKINFLFMRTSKQASFFLPREFAKSADAKIIKDHTIQGCGMKGEDKLYATSLESMVDYITLKVGKNVDALCTEVVVKNGTKKREYKITKKVEETKLVACHKLNYVCAVFYCHKLGKTVNYTVSLKGADGSRVKAISVCHKDTSAWNPKHLAFQVVKVKPGAAPVCHFIPQGDVMWVLKQN